MSPRHMMRRAEARQHLVEDQHHLSRSESAGSRVSRGYPNSSLAGDVFQGSSAKVRWMMTGGSPDDWGVKVQADLRELGSSLWPVSNSSGGHHMNPQTHFIQHRNAELVESYTYLAALR